MSDPEENPDIRLSPACTARFLGAAKGYGVVATRDIKNGEFILRDIATITVDDEDTFSEKAQEAINEQYENLSNADQDKFDKLHFYTADKNRAYIEQRSAAVSSEEERQEFLTRYERVMTFATNCFDVTASKTEAGLFLQGSRFNHSCLPSAEYNVFRSRGRLPEGAPLPPVRWECYAVRDIAQGEEITLGYNFRLLSREGRRRALENCWGFPCGCEVCDLDGPDEGRLSREYDCNLRDLRKDERFWHETPWVHREWDKEALEAHLARLEDRLAMCRANSIQEGVWKNLELASKFCAALWYRTDQKNDEYLRKWREYLQEARWGVCHRSMLEAELGGDWDLLAAECLEKGRPDPDEIWTDTESDGGLDEWEVK
ncbi:hypothetical protein PG987_007327 [Apiospora arundinis]